MEPEERELTNEYDSTGKVTRQTQADGTTYQFAYTLGTGGKVTQTDVTDPRGNVRRVTFNGEGYTLTDTRALGTAIAQTTTYERQAGSNLPTATIDALGRRTETTYDAKGNLLTVTRLGGTPNAVPTTFTYEPTFNQVASVTNGLNQTTTFGYDAQGNLTSATDPLSHVTTLAYNPFGQPVSVTDPLNQTRTFAYDPTSRSLVSVADPLGNVTTRGYDVVGRVVSQTDPRGLSTSRVYDALNRITKIVDAKLGATQFSYDANGNLLTVTDTRGSTTSYTYDAMDRVTTRTDALGHGESYLYDSVGNLTQHTDRKGQVATLGYDALNRRTGATYTDATVAYTFDLVNRVTQLTDSAGGTLTNAYDSFDRLTAQTTALGTVGYQYDAAGRRTQMTVPNQSPVAYAYDAASRLTSITQGSNLVQFTYDTTNRRTTLTLPNGVSTQYSYDAASRLTALTYKLGTTPLGDLQYTYDDAGNRMQVGGTWARTSLPQVVATATYNANNQQTAFGSQTLSYDLNGNLTGDGTNTYAWDARNRLMAINGPGPASFAYDAASRRIRKVVDAVTTDFVYDFVNPVQEQSGQTMTNVLAGFGTDEYFGRADATSVGFFLTDALGSTVAITDAVGAVGTSYTYEPFGAATATGNPNANPSQYAGRESDGTGLHYYRARYYHPHLARFISEDPIRFRGGDVNLYAYVRNAPLTFRDPFGLETCPAEGPTPPQDPRQSFGQRGPEFHGGWDINNGFGRPVVAVAGGTVISITPVDCSPGADSAYPCGTPTENRVLVQHANGAQTLYVHTSPSVTLGPVSEGQMIGRTDLSGRTTGPHLHFEYFPPGEAQSADPASILSGCKPYPYPGGVDPDAGPGGAPSGSGGGDLGGRKS